MKASWKKHLLHFRKPAGTSRGVMLNKPAYYILLNDPVSDFTAIGECGLLPGLSADDRPGYEDMLQVVVDALNCKTSMPDLTAWPSIALGLDMAQRNLACREAGMVWPSEFSTGQASIPINGLVWMGTAEEMKEQIDAKLAEGFACIKLKIGAIDFEQELKLLVYIRTLYPADVVEIRVDANGAFSPEDAPRKLEQLSAFGLHSIEQPIRAGQWEAMARLCANTPVPIALDEELIGISSQQLMHQLMDRVKPQGIVLKPSFLGTFAASDQWIALANAHGAMWWITSALESNVGLNAIAQYTFLHLNGQHQGLGTGLLYTNNIASPLEVAGGHLHYRNHLSWDFTPLI